MYHSFYPYSEVPRWPQAQKYTNAYGGHGRFRRACRRSHSPALPPLQGATAVPLSSSGMVVMSETGSPRETIDEVKPHHGRMSPSVPPLPPAGSPRETIDEVKTHHGRMSPSVPPLPPVPTSRPTSRERETTHRSALLELFHEADRDNSNTIDMREFVAMCKAIMPMVEPRQYHTVFKSLDLNSDRVVSPEEFLRVSFEIMRTQSDDSFAKGLQLAMGKIKNGTLRDALAPAPTAPVEDSTTPDTFLGSPNDTIWNAAALGSMDAVKRHLAGDLTLINRAEESSGKGPIGFCGPNGHFSLTTFLLERGALVTKSTMWNCQSPKFRQLLKQHKQQHITHELCRPCEDEVCACQRQRLDETI